MRRLSLLFFILVLAVGLLPAQSTALADGWVKFVSAEGAFTAQFPLEPQPSVDRKDHPQGEIVTHMFLAVTPEPFLCIVGYTDYPIDVDVEGELAADRDNFVKEVHGTVTNSQRKDFMRAPGDALPSLDFVATSDRGTFKGTVIVVGRRAYIAVTFSPNGSNHAADVDRFFSAFKLSPRKS